MASYLTDSSLTVTILDVGAVRDRVYPILSEEVWLACCDATCSYARCASPDHRESQRFLLTLYREPTDALGAAQAALAMMGRSLDDTTADREKYYKSRASASQRRADGSKFRNAPGGSWDHQGR